MSSAEENKSNKNPSARDTKRSKFNKVEQKQKFGGGFDSIQIFESKHKVLKDREPEEQSSAHQEQHDNRASREDDENEQIMWPTKQTSNNQKKKQSVHTKREMARMQHDSEQSDNEHSGFVDKRLLT